MADFIVPCFFKNKYEKEVVKVFLKWCRRHMSNNEALKKYEALFNEQNKEKKLKERKEKLKKLEKDGKV